MQDHPFLVSIRSRIAYVLIWLFISLAWFFFEVATYRIRPGMALADSLFLNASFSLISIGLYYTVKFGTIEKNLLSVFLQHFAGMVVTITLWLLFCYLFVILIEQEENSYQQFFRTTFSLRIAAGVFYYGIIVLLYYLIIYYQNFRETATREAELKALVRETELSVLRSQIKPHFLFNSLNSISSLTLTQPDAAREMIIKLSDFLRYSLGESERALVPLKAEIDFIRLYLDIEKVRFGDKLVAEWDIPEKCLESKLPNMILQPVYENAIKHGVYESQEVVLIRTVCRSDGNDLVLIIENNFDPESLPRKGKGMGLENIRKRMHLIYRRDDLLNVVRRNSVFSVELRVPQGDYH
ncbi:MAG: sensor histidine kinase [Bacteroidales bacterium]